MAKEYKEEKETGSILTWISFILTKPNGNYQFIIKISHVERFISGKIHYISERPNISAKRLMLGMTSVLPIHLWEHTVKTLGFQHRNPFFVLID